MILHDSYHRSYHNNCTWKHRTTQCNHSSDEIVFLGVIVSWYWCCSFKIKDVFIIHINSITFPRHKYSCNYSISKYLLLGCKNKNNSLSYSFLLSIEIFDISIDPFKSTFSVLWNRKEGLVTNTMPAISTAPRNILHGTTTEESYNLLKI